MGNDEEMLKHHGIKGQKWGVRRFQNKDGTLTSAGQKRYSDSSEVSEIENRLDYPKNISNTTKKVINDYNTLNDSDFRKKYKVSKQVYKRRVKKYGDPYMNSPLAKLGKWLSRKDKTLRMKKTVEKAYTKQIKEIEQEQLRDAQKFAQQYYGESYEAVNRGFGMVIQPVDTGKRIIP